MTQRDLKVKGQIMYFLVNASPPQLVHVATSNFASSYVTWCRWHWAIFYATLRSRSLNLFIVNAYPLQPLDVARINFIGVLD